MLSKKRELNPEQIREIIRASADPLPILKERVASGGKVNAYNALLAVEKLKSSTPALLKSFAKPAAQPRKDDLTRKISSKKKNLNSLSEAFDRL